MDNIRRLPYVKHFDCFFKEGDVIAPIENSTARAGYFIATGKTFDEMINHVEAVFEAFKVLDEEDENMVIKYRDYTTRYTFSNPD